MQNPHTPASRLRILQASFTLHAPGARDWLMNVWREIDKSRYQFDFLTYDGEPGPHDEEIVRLGGRLVPVPHVSRRGAFLRAVRKAMVEGGPYDIIHAHPFALSGLVQLQAARARIPVRLTHAHTDRRKAQRDKKWSGRLYGWFSRRLIRQFSTHGLASSMDAATGLFGDHWWFDPRWQVMPCGLDLSPYDTRPASDPRAPWGLTRQSRVIGHVGSFEIEKNHDFLIHLFAQLARSDPKLVLLLVGEGPLRPAIERLVAEKGLVPRVIFAGDHPDLSACFRAMDVFVLPSLYDNQGLALVEAQAAGLPCVASDVLPPDSDVVKGAVSFLPLHEGLDPWMEAIDLALSMPKPHAAQALDLVKISDYNIETNVSHLAQLYERLYVERLGG